MLFHNLAYLYISIFPLNGLCVSAGSLWAPIAAINRGRGVAEGYRDTPAVADALAVMIEGYLHLDDTEQANKLRQLLVELQPNHPQLKGKKGFVQLHPADKPDKTLLQILSFDLF